MALLTREQILEAAKSRRTLTQETITVPELGGEVIVRMLTGTERDAFEATVVQHRGPRPIVSTDNIRARLVVRCVVNEAGERLFTDDDADAVGELGAAPLSRLYDVASRLNRVTPADVEELKKSSAAAAGADSPSPSPSASGG